MNQFEHLKEEDSGEQEMKEINDTDGGTINNNNNNIRRKVEPLVWIVGCSIIRRLHTHIRAQRLDESLGLRCEIRWAPDTGPWERLLPALRSLSASSSRAPDVVLLHLGGDSLLHEGRNRLGFLRLITRDLSECFRMFPGTRFLFSEILPRLRWRGQTGKSYGVERGRRWVNGRVCRFLAERQMRRVRHRNIGLIHLCGDGVHLSPEGNQRLMSNLRDALQEELRR
ncbi:eukaryotic translation initiation factor 4E family member 2 related sequence 1 isoform X2 [Pimephales promelas]|uniref:eukaryotic translation initiation factor 4E family member 2 related sequence 1 isoform X2 n=1 Tax=Pimephales promelas TaxID=90988 RepID=UPI00195583F4|nr:eukaryotic translation initiation factor 4E family member 2 related sequence 1 isoform X2 [Pimephales promelas]